MSTTISPNNAGEPTVSELVGGIVEDVHDLGVKQLALFCNEVRQDLATIRDAVASIVIGLAVTQIGGVLICFALAQVLTILVPTMPLWLSYGIVGAVVLGLGVFALIIGINKSQQFDAHIKSLTGMVKENSQCLTKSS